MQTALKQTEEDLETGLPFSNVGIPLLHCLPVQQAEKLTSDSVNVEKHKSCHETVLIFRQKLLNMLADVFC